MPDPKEKLKKLHANLIKDGYDLPSFDVFDKDMSDVAKLSKLRDNLVKEGYDLPDLNTFQADMGFSQKKSQVGSTNGGQAGISEAPSGLTEVKVSGGLIPEYKGVVGEVKVDKIDPVKSYRNQLNTQVDKSLEKLLQRERQPKISTTAVTLTAPVAAEKIKEERKQFVEEQKEKKEKKLLSPAEIDKKFKEAKRVYSEDQNTSVAHLMESSGLSANEIFNLPKDKLQSLVRPGNETDELAVKAISDSQDVKNSLKNATSLPEAAIYFAAKQDPQLQEQIDRNIIPGTNRVNIESILKEGSIGTRVAEFLFNPIVEKEIKNNLGYQKEFEATLPVLINKYPDFGKAYLGNKISQKMEDMGITNSLVNVTTEEETDKAVEELEKENKITPNEVQFYKDNLRGEGGYKDFFRNIIGKGYYKTPGFIENTLGGAVRGTLAIGKGASEKLGLRKALLGETEVTARDFSDRDLAVNIAPRGITHEITMSGGETIGQLAPFIFGGAELMAAKAALSPEIASGLLFGLQTYGNNIAEARRLFPGNELKQRGFATTASLIDAVLLNKLGSSNIAKSLSGEMRPAVQEIIDSYASKKISKETAQEGIKGAFLNAVKKVPQAAELFARQTGKNTAIMTAMDLAHQVNEGVFEGKKVKDWINGQKTFENARSAAIASTFLSGLGTAATLKNKGVISKLHYQYAEQPDFWEAEIRKVGEANGEPKADIEDKVDNVKYAAKVFQDLKGSTDMSEKQKMKFLINSLIQRAKLKEVESITDPVLKQRATTEAKKIQEDQEALLDGKDDGTIEGDVSDVIEGENLIDKKRAEEAPLPVTEKPSKEQQNKEILEGNTVTYTYEKESDVPEVFKDNIVSRGDVNGKPRISVIVAKSLSDYELGKKEALIPKEEKPSDEQQFKDIQEGNVVTFTYENESQVPEVFKDKISSTGETNGKPFVRVTVAKSLADYELGQKETPSLPEVKEEVKVEGEVVPKLSVSEAEKTAIQDLEKEEKSKVDLKGEPRELWQLPFSEGESKIKTGDLGVTEKGELGKGVNVSELQKRLIEDALKEGKYEKAIEEGSMSPAYARKIIESAGLEVPQDILIDAELQLKPKTEAELPSEQKPITEEEIKTQQYAIQEPSTGEVLQRPQEGAGEAGGKRGGMEQGVKGTKVTEEGKVEGKEGEEVVPPVPPTEAKVFKEELPSEMSGIAHAETERMRTALGLPEYERVTGKSDRELDAEAQEQIKKGYNVEKLIKSIEEGNPPTGVENYILARYKGALEKEFERTQSDDVLNKLKRLSDATDFIGTKQSESFRTRKALVPKEETLSQYFLDEMADAGVDKLTEQQKATVTEEYKAINDAKEALQKKVEELQAENAKLKANEEIAKDKKAAKRVRKTDQQFAEERKQIITDIRAKLKKARGQAQMAAVPYANELIAIAPDVAKLAKSLVEQGIVKLEALAARIKDDLKEEIPDITEKDVIDLLAGEYTQKKKTKNQLAEQLKDLKDEAKLINKLAALEAGEEPKTERKKIERNREITDLRNRIKDLKRAKKEELGEEKISKSDLEIAKSKIKTQIQRVEKDLKEGNFDKEPEKREIFLDEEGRKLRAKLLDLRREREVRRLKLQYEQRTKKEKAIDKIVDVFNIPRSVMASTDFSAPLNQAFVATINYPKEAKAAAEQMIKSAFSQKAFDEWFYELKEEPRYELMKELKLGISDPHSPFLTAREEAFMSGMAERIPVAGEFIKGSERAYVQYLNKLRVDLFNRFIDRFESQGKTFRNSPKLYEATAKYINNITGKGDLGKLDQFAPVFNALMFSPRLMASRVNLLNPYYFAKLPKELKIQYGKDMGSALALGSTILSLFAIYGMTQKDDDKNKITVETDPRSTDFGRIRQGNTRWDIWGGFQPYVRLAAQVGYGERKSSNTGLIQSLDGEGAFGQTRGDVLTTFARGKLAPIPAMVIDLIQGRNAMGEKVELKDELLSHIIPLSSQAIAEGVKEYGPKGVAVAGLPAVFGIGVQSYEPKQKEVKGEIEWQDRKIKLSDEEKKFFQNKYDELSKANVDKLSKLPEYKQLDLETQVALKGLVQKASMRDAEDVLIKRYRAKFRQVKRERGEDDKKIDIIKRKLRLK